MKFIHDNFSECIILPNLLKTPCFEYDLRLMIDDELMFFCNKLTYAHGLYTLNFLLNTISR